MQHLTPLDWLIIAFAMAGGLMAVYAAFDIARMRREARQRDEQFDKVMERLLRENSRG